MTIKQMQAMAHATAKAKGFYSEPISIGTLIALIHSEASEALEAYRDGESWDRVGEELADVVIRVADMCGRCDIDLEATIVAKMAKNKTRPHKHGGKRF